MNIELEASRRMTRLRKWLAAFALMILLPVNASADWVPAVWPGHTAPHFQDPIAACRYSKNDIYGGSQYLMNVGFYRNGAGVAIQVECQFPWIAGSRLSGFATLQCPTGMHGAPWAPGGCTSPSQDDPGEPSCPAKAGNPIDLISGNKYETVTDFSTDGARPLELIRTYNSQWMSTSRLGAGWRTNFDRNFYTDTNNWVRITLGDGREALFAATTSGSGVWVPAYPTPAGNSMIQGRTDKSWALVKTSGGWTFTDTDGTVETYDSNLRLTSITYVGGYSQTLSYDASGNNTAVTDTYGRSIQFGYSTRGILTSVTAPDNQIYYYGYVDRSGQTSGGSEAAETIDTGVPSPGVVLSTVDYPAAPPLAVPRVTYHYEDDANITALTGITNESSVRFATWSYDANGYAKSSQHSGGAEHTDITYDLTGNTRTVTNVLGRQAVYTLGSKQGSLKRIEQIQGQADSTCAGTTSSIGYDSNGYTNQLVDARGHTTTIVNDAKGRPQTRNEAVGTPQARSSTTVWNAGFNLPDEIDEPGRKTTFSYDGSGNLLTKTVTDLATATSRTWTYSSYTANGRPGTIDGPRTDVSDVTQLSYYPVVPGVTGSGELSTITDSLGHITTINSYDANGRPLQITDPNGVTTLLAYWPRGWLKSVQVASEITLLDYWPTGLLKQVTQPDGKILQYSYSDAGYLTDVYDQLGNHIHYTLDDAGNVKQTDVYDASATLVQTESQTFDSLSRLRKRIGAYSGETYQYDYDANDNLTSIQDPLTHLTSLSYDGLDRLGKVTDAASKDTVYHQNALDQLDSVTDPRVLTTGYTVNALGDVKGTNSPDTAVSSATHDAAGNIKTSTDAKGQTTTYSYDALNRLTLLSRTGGTSVVYTWDQNDSAHGYGVGRLTRVVDSLSGATVDFKYDARGRVVGKTTVIGGKTMTMGWTYDATTGRLTEMVLPSGKSVLYTWTNGVITALSLKNGATTTAILSSISYQPFGGPKRWIHANGEVAQRTFNLNGQITSDPVDQLISYDTASRVTSYQLGNHSVLADTHVIGYDNLDRVTSFSDALASFTYYYDDTGNRTQQIVAGTTTNFTIDPLSNRVTQAAAGSAIVSYSYDANGSRSGSSSGSRIFTYDTSGRLSAFQSTDHTASYLYDGLGQRVQKTVDGTVSRFAYDNEGKLIADYRSNILVGETVYLGTMPVAIISGNSTYAVHADWRDAPRQVDDSNQVAVWAWDPAAFGGGAPNERPNGQLLKFTLNLRYPGQYYDDETGHFYNNARYYDSALGRYVESDPAGLNGGSNTYAYVGGDPLSWIDPSGLNGEAARDWARRHVGGDGYGFFDTSGESRGRWQDRLNLGGRASFKCNKFAFDALAAGGNPPGRTLDGRIPSASEWGNPNFTIPGYYVLPSWAPLKPGDVVSNGHHVGIIDPSLGPVNEPATTSAAPPRWLGGPPDSGWDGGILNNDWGFRPGQSFTFRRCECDM